MTGIPGSTVFAQQNKAISGWLIVLRHPQNSLIGIAFLFIAWIMGIGAGLIFTFLFWHLQVGFRIFTFIVNPLIIFNNIKINRILVAPRPYLDWLAL